MDAPPAPRAITLAEAQEHMSEKDCWLIMDGKVYDVTPFLDEHPGGFDTLVSNSGALTKRAAGSTAHAGMGDDPDRTARVGEAPWSAPAPLPPRRCASSILFASFIP